MSLHIISEMELVETCVRWYLVRCRLYSRVAKLRLSTWKFLLKFVLIDVAW